MESHTEVISYPQPKGQKAVQSLNIVVEVKSVLDPSQIPFGCMDFKLYPLITCSSS